MNIRKENDSYVFTPNSEKESNILDAILELYGVNNIDYNKSNYEVIIESDGRVFYSIDEFENNNSPSR